MCEIDCQRYSVALAKQTTSLLRPPCRVVGPTCSPGAFLWCPTHPHGALKRSQEKKMGTASQPPAASDPRIRPHGLMQGTAEPANQEPAPGVRPLATPSFGIQSSQLFAPSGSPATTPLRCFFLSSSMDQPSYDATLLALGVPFGFGVFRGVGEEAMQRVFVRPVRQQREKWGDLMQPETTSAGACWGSRLNRDSGRHDAPIVLSEAPAVPHWSPTPVGAG